MPKREAITATPNPWKPGASIWFDDGDGNILSGVVKTVDGTTVNVRSGSGSFICDVNEDRLWDHNPATKAAVVTPEPAGPSGDDPGPKGVEGVNGVDLQPMPKLGAPVEFRTSVGLEKGTVQEYDGNDIMVLKPGNTKKTRVKNGAWKVLDAAPAAPAPAAPAAAPAPAPAPTAVATRPSAVPAKAAAFSNVMGDVLDDPELLMVPRLLIAQTVKDHEKLGLKRGDICLGMGEDPSGWITIASSPGKVKSRTPAPGVAISVLLVDAYWIEQVPYETEKDDGSQPLMARTRDELQAVTAKAQYEMGTEAKLMLAVEAPAGVTHEFFRYEINGRRFALATFKAARTGFRPIVVPINSKVKLGEQPPQNWHFNLFSEIVEGEKNIFAKPVLTCEGQWDADTIAQLSAFIPVRD